MWLPLTHLSWNRVHHHGMASLPAFDGWADQYFCYDETKDYVLPNNRHATQYYHDHAVGITSENAYNGGLWQVV